MELFYFFLNSNFKRNFLTLKDADIDLKITKELPFQLKIIYDVKDGDDGARFEIQKRHNNNNKLMFEKNK